MFDCCTSGTELGHGRRVAVAMTDESLLPCRFLPWFSFPAGCFFHHQHQLLDSWRTMSFFRCPRCSRTFSLRRHMTWHMQRAHGTSHFAGASAANASGAASLPSPLPPHPLARVPDAGTGASSVSPATAPSPPRASDADVGAPVPSPSPASTGAAPDTNAAVLGDEYHAAAVDRQMAQLAKTAAACAAPERPAAKRRRGQRGGAVSGPDPRYATLSAELRAGYEDLKDWERSEPIITPRKHSRPGMFNSYRLRALQRFALTCGDGAGLTGAELDHLYDLLDIWDRTKPGMPVDAGHNQSLRDVFKSPYAFQKAVRDDVDAAVLEAGWRRVTLAQNGDTLVAYFRPVLEVVLSLMRESKNIRYWSGGDQPAQPTSMRETPFDGDAFRMNEQEVVREHGSESFVLGLHVYSDATQISKSGGKWRGATRGSISFFLDCWWWGDSCRLLGHRSDLSVHDPCWLVVDHSV